MPAVLLQTSSQPKPTATTIVNREHDDDDDKQTPHHTKTDAMDGKENRREAYEHADSGAKRGVAVPLAPPQTPGRISLSDLIANPEEMLAQVPTATPCEQITWKRNSELLEYSPSSSASASATQRTQRGTKRPYSPSPSASQARRARFFQADNGYDPKDRKDLKNRTRRPSPVQDDPAAILWRDHAGPHNEPLLPPLPPIDLSPERSSGERRDCTFRRTASCGTEWPTSVRKRRKMVHHDPHSTTKQIFASRRRDLLRPETSKQSRVSILLETVQQTMAARQRQQDEPSSSSPLPERKESPVPLIQPPSNSQKRDHSPRKLPQPTPAMPHGSSPLKAKSNDSSDYGDLDFDDDDLEDIEMAISQTRDSRQDSNLDQMHPAPEALPSRPSQQQNKQQQQRTCSQTRDRLVADHVTLYKPPDTSAAAAAATTTTTTTTARAVPAVTNLPSLMEVDLFDDPFDDDDDDDIFNDELHKLVDEVESQQTGPQVPNLPAATVVRPAPNVGSLDGAFDDDDFDDAIFDEIDNVTEPQLDDDDDDSSAAKKQTQSDNRSFNRYLVVKVVEDTYEYAPGKSRPQKLLSIKDEKTKQLFVLLLRQSWYDTRCSSGAYVHVVGRFDRQAQCIVDDNQNMVIVHPDHLISATVVGDAITCLRRAVLQDRVKATSPPQRPQVYGHIIHELFGEALRLNKWDWETIRTIIARILPTYIESLYEVGVQLADATEYLMTKVPLLRAWAEYFVAATFVPDALIRDRRDALVPLAINKLLEVEEHVWSPMYGLKGNIDATVQAEIQLPGDDFSKNVVAPLELKTGLKDNNGAHRAQTALYTLLLSDRYDVNVTSGILYYMETSKTFRIEGVSHEIRQMIIWRNLLASYVHNKLELPDMIKRDHLCKRCYAQTSCFTYHKLVEGGDRETSGMKETFDDAVGHLQAQHQAFFKSWDGLLTKEERDYMKFKRELWTMLSTEREQVGRCFANVVIESGSATENLDGSKINRFTYSFTKTKDSQQDFCFTESQITVGEPIVVSDEKGHFALANGYVTAVRPKRVTVAVDRRLQNARQRTKDFNADTNQSFVGIMEVTLDGIPNPSAADSDEPILYRVDKDEFANGMATIRNNLIRIMEKDLFKAQELRSLIIENKPPTFKPISTAYSLSGPASQTNVNVDQRAAIDKVMSARDYALVLGMPGTGKTTTIAHIIRALVSQGKSVLLTSYTHTAVDNILLKIKDDGIPVLRLGSVAKVHPDVQAFADLAGVPKTTMEELERSWSTSKVVATTCLGINHGIFNHRIFDYCIVDEASQITLPVCLGPIRMAHTFILVGDHFQLPPLVQNKEAQEGGLDVSLFKLLSDAQPSSVVCLEHQYRMAEDIMSLANELIYNGRLKCGTSKVASRMLQVPNLPGALEAHHHRADHTASQCGLAASDCWLRTALAPTNRAVMFDTDTIAIPDRATEVLTGSNQRITNPAESVVVSQLLTTLVRAGVPAKSIGVITFYRSQLALLRQDVKAIAGSTIAGEVEMHTADKYQGRDKEVILLSCVRSNASNEVGELLKDWRRVNVAITRAKSKLVIFGSKSTLQGSRVPVLEGLVRIMSNKGWLHALPAAATHDHAFAGAGPTQTQAPTQAVRAVHEATRRPLTTVSANSVAGRQISETTPKLPRSVKASAPFKQPKQRAVRGRTLDTMLDRNPGMRNVLNDIGLDESSGAIFTVHEDTTLPDEMIDF